ncbi:hypothetical protein DFH11DRAFT_1575443 [Phellopilus nigrolimitatus]|nr:hypothetical protein DFH11DRAFT_1575443 [Phellopilus nigrolimitatus]
MDNAGWHASRRAQRNSGLYENPQRGPDGRYDPVEQVSPVNDGFIGGFNVNSAQPNRLQIPDYTAPQLPPRPNDYPPTPPAKDGVSYFTGPNGARFHNPDFSRQASQQSYATLDSRGDSFMSKMNAVDRSRYLRAVRMDPYLQLMVGPLLRYDTVDEHGVWNGACMVVSSDATSIYEPHPMLTYEWDPQGTGISRSTSHINGKGRSFDLGPHPADPHSDAALLDANGSSLQSSTARKESVPGHEIWVYEDPRGRTFTFWRFMIQIPLNQNEMCVRYTINGGQALEFFVPGRNENMKWAAHSCNGFSAGINSDDFRGPGFDSGYDPVWIDLLKKHELSPFHVLVGGGDQIYCDGLTREPEMQEWLQLSKPELKLRYQITLEMRAALDRFYFNHYCRVFQSGAFARATASIPMVNMADPDDLQRSSVFNTIGARGYFFFLLFQCFINVEVDGTDDRLGAHSNKSVIIGQRGPYIPYPSHSFLSYLGPNCSILLLDCRAERRKDQVCSPYEYNKVFEKIYRLPPQVQHLVVQLGIPIAYPRMNFMESLLESKLNPLVAMGKRGSTKVGGFVNKFNADAELLDDLAERNEFILKLQEYSRRTHTRVTFLSGDVHCAAVGVFKTLVKEKKQPDINPAIDHRYMLNIITSDPPNAVLSLVTNRASKNHQTLHYAETDESMIPLFTQDTDGSTGNSKVVMGRRNFCMVEYDSNGNLVFDIRVEKEKGYGTTVGYPIRAPGPHWQ